MMFGDYAQVTEISEELQTRAAEAFGLLLRAVQRAVRERAFPTEPGAGAIATALWAHAHGLVTLEPGAFIPPAAADPAAIFDRATRAVIDGWSVRPV